METFERGDGLKIVKMFCLKCKEQTVVSGPQVVILKSKRKAVKGQCPTCQTMMFKFVPNTED